jgi:hypothetical protein
VAVSRHFVNPVGICHFPAGILKVCLSFLIFRSAIVFFRPESEKSGRTPQNADRNFEIPIANRENACRHFEVPIGVGHIPAGILKICLTFVIFRSAIVFFRSESENSVRTLQNADRNFENPIGNREMPAGILEF